MTLTEEDEKLKEGLFRLLVWVTLGIKIVE
jgi:hypothetical protein